MRLTDRSPYPDLPIETDAVFGDNQGACARTATTGEPGPHGASDELALCTLTFVSRAVEINAGSAGDIPQLREAFLSLHDHHRRLSAVVLTEPDERAWAARVSTYEDYFAEGRALLHLGLIAGRCVGYALTVLHRGSDDTFPLRAGYAELYTLAVVPDARGSGIGSALLDAVEAELSNRGIANLTVAVMCANEAAIRLYRRRGFIPGELILYRIGDEPSDLVMQEGGTN